MIAGWARRRAAALLDDLARLDGRPLTVDLRDELRSVEAALRIRSEHRADLDQRAAAIAARAGLDQLHAQHDHNRPIGGST